MQLDNSTACRRIHIVLTDTWNVYFESKCLYLCKAFWAFSVFVIWLCYHPNLYIFISQWSNFLIFIILSFMRFHIPPSLQKVFNEWLKICRLIELTFNACYFWCVVERLFIWGIYTFSFAVRFWKGNSWDYIYIDTHSLCQKIARSYPKSNH